MQINEELLLEWFKEQGLIKGENIPRKGDQSLFENEKNRIKKILSEEVYDVFKENRVVLAGGAITSLFTNAIINDLDIYFKDKNGFCKVIHEAYSNEWVNGFNQLRVNHTTDRSILCSGEHDIKIQLIVYKLFPTINDIFNAFDFTINMGAYDFETESFVFHEDFFKHNAQRYIDFNPKTDYPLISAMRVQKYVERGYTISKAQMLRILLAVNNKNIDSWEVFVDEVSGMYGLEPGEIFDMEKSISVEEAITQLDKVFLPGKHYEKNIPQDKRKLFEKYPHLLTDNVVMWMEENKNKMPWELNELPF